MRGETRKKKGNLYIHMVIILHKFETIWTKLLDNPSRTICTYVSENVIQFLKITVALHNEQANTHFLLISIPFILEILQIYK